MVSFDAGGLLESVIRVVLRALILFIGIAAAVQQTAKQAVALAGAVAAGETGSAALSVGAVGLLGAALGAKWLYEKGGPATRKAATATGKSGTQIDMVGPETRDATRALVEDLAKLVESVETDDLDGAAAHAAAVMERAAELKAAVDERIHLQENAKSMVKSLQPPSSRPNSVLLLPDDERADILKRLPCEVRNAFAELPGGLGKADGEFMAQAAAGCRQFLVHKGIAVLQLCSMNYREALVWRLKLEQSKEFACLLAHLLQRSRAGRSAPGRVQRERALLIGVSVERAALRSRFYV